MPDVKFNITTEGEKALFQELQRLSNESDKLKRKLADVGKTADNAGSQGGSSFSMLSKEIGKVASSLVGPGGLVGVVTASVGVIKDEYDKLVQAGKEASQRQVNIAGARSNALINLPPDFVGGKKALDDLAVRVSKQAGLGLDKVYESLNSALSAKGSLKGQAFENAISLGASLESLTGGRTKAGTMAGTLMDLARMTGQENAMSNLGWLRQAGASARITSLEGQSRMVPGIATGMAFGDTAEQALEMQAAISQIITDPTGEKTATGYQNLVSSLVEKEVVPYSEVNAKTGKKETKWKRLEGANTLERIAGLQKVYGSADKDTKADIMQKLGGEANMMSFMSAMMQNSDLYTRTLAATQSQIGSPDAVAAAQAKNFIQDTMSGKFAVTAKTQRQSDMFMEDVDINNQRKALESQAVELSENAARKLGIGKSGQLNIPLFHTMSKAIERSLTGMTIAEQEATRWAQYGDSKDPQVTQLIGTLMNIAEQEKALVQVLSDKRVGSPNAQENN